MVFRKKRILFVLTSFATGGINRAFQNFLNKYDTSLYDIDVFVLSWQGVYSGQFANCTLLPSNKHLNLLFSRYDSQKGLNKVESAISKALDKYTKGRYQQWLFTKSGKSLLRKVKYDAVVGFGEGAPKTFVSLMNHPNKIGWIHCDYASYYEINHHKQEREVFESLTSIVCVSNYTRESFLQFYSDFSAKTYSIYNILDDEMMRDQSRYPLEDYFDGKKFNIVSIGRLDPVKRLSVIPEIARRIIDLGCSICWYVIGPAGGTLDEHNRLFDNIRKYGVEGDVIPLGAKSNPYPYIANADLLVNTSVSEACPYVINEAKILGTPVVCTNFGSAREFVDNGINGYYAPLDEMSALITNIIKDDNILKTMRNNLGSFKYDNEHILNQIYSLFK